MSVTAERDNLQVIYNIIQNIVNSDLTDVNTSRSSQSTLDDRRRVWPEMSNKFDDPNKFPMYIVKFSTPKFVDYGSENFVEETESAGVVTSETYGQAMIVPVIVAIVVQKDQQFNIINPPNSAQNAKNRVLANFLAQQFRRELMKQRSDFINQEMDIHGEPTITTAYRDNDFVFLATVEFNVWCLDTWSDDVTAISSVESLTVTVETS